jgi:hypothetical protein
VKKLLGLALLLVAHPALADYVGDFKLGTTLDFTVFNTYKSTDGSDLQRTAAGTPSCVDNGGTGEITAGVTDSGTTAFDGATGANKLTIVATGANGYAAGHNYFCGFRAATLNGVTVSALNVVSFSIENRAPLKGLILARGVLNSGSTTSVVNVGAALTFTGQYVSRVIENTDTGEQQCITASTDNGSNDTVTIAPNVPTAWSAGANWAIYNGVPCYPVTLPAVDGTGRVYVAGVDPSHLFDSDWAANIITHFKNGGALSSFKLDDIQTQLSATKSSADNAANLLQATIEPNGPISVKCALALILARGAGQWAASGDSVVFRDMTNTSQRLAGTTNITGTALSGVTYNCPP